MLAALLLNLPSPSGGHGSPTSRGGAGGTRPWLRMPRAKVGDNEGLDIRHEYGGAAADEADILDIVTVFTLMQDQRR